MKAVHFGAGNIGRGFIGQLLVQSGYEVTFVDVNSSLVELLQNQGRYPVLLAGETLETLWVEGVTALPGQDLDAVAQAVALADLVTTAVGVNILPYIAPAISQGLVLRLNAEPRNLLHVIACENTIGGSDQLRAHVKAALETSHEEAALAVARFPNAAVDRIVPLQEPGENPLAVQVEPFYEWIVDASAVEHGALPLQGVTFVDPLMPYIERKLFTVNTGHCCAAYLGYLKGKVTIQEAMKDAFIFETVLGVLEETGAVLTNKYSWNQEEHRGYIHKIMSRFQNPQLLDEVVRVGRSPIRKLSFHDRLVAPAVQAFERGLHYKNLAFCMAAATQFDDPRDTEAVEIQASIAAVGISETITRYTSLNFEHPIHQEILAQLELVKQL